MNHVGNNAGPAETRERKRESAYENRREKISRVRKWAEKANGNDGGCKLGGRKKMWSELKRRTQHSMVQESTEHILYTSNLAKTQTVLASFDGTSTVLYIPILTFYTVRPNFGVMR